MCAATAVLALATTVLAGCKSNAGIAATVDGQRISESTVNDYLTPHAQPVQSTNSQNVTVTLLPRVAVMTVLISERLFRKVLSKTRAGVPSQGQLDAAVKRQFPGMSPAQAAERIGVNGYTAAFDKKLAEYEALGSLLRAEQQSGVDLRAIFVKLHFHVRVSPRYGAWNDRAFELDGAPTAGLPGFLDLQPDPGTGG